MLADEWDIRTKLGALRIIRALGVTLITPQDYDGSEGHAACCGKMR